MKVLNIHGPGDIRLDPLDPPQAGPHDVVIEVEVCGICGSDLSYVKWGGFGDVSPMPLGHEAVGVVTEIGGEVADLALGDRVILNPMTRSGVIGNGGREGAFASSLLVREAVVGETLFAIPQGLSAEVAALAEPLAVAMHAVTRSKARAGDRTVVFGAGPIGLGIVTWLRRLGARDIVSVDINPQRLELAAKLGATHVVNPMEEDLAQRLAALHGEASVIGRSAVGTDIFFDAAGSATIVPQVIGMARHGATLVVSAVHGQPVPIDLGEALRCELSILMSMGYPSEFSEVVDALVEVGDTVAGMITHRFAFEDVVKAFDEAASPGAGKIMVHMR